MKEIKQNEYQGPERRRVNGERTLMYWIMGIMGAVIMMGMGTTTSFVLAQLDTINVELNNRSSRIASNETSVQVLTKRLDRFDVKLDIIIEKINDRA